ncbi:MAG: hypothetical protein QOF96_4156 [Actinomycetota bacterium]|nr:hypothetical protein [Actinomycetota bacterium]
MARRRGAGSAAGLGRVGLALAVGLAAGAAVRPAGAQTATTTVTRGQAVRQVLAQRDEALRSGDRAAFLDTVDPSASAEFRVRQGRLYDGLRSLPLASYELRLRTDEVPDLAGGGLTGRYPDADEVFLPPVEAHYRFTGIDTIDAVDGYYYTFLLRGGRWRIVSDGDVNDVGLPSARNLWDYGPVSQERTAHFTVLHDPADGKRATVLASLCEEAYARLTATFGRPAPAQIVVVLPHNLDQLREILQATFDLSNFVAFASASVDRDEDWQSTAARVYVQDANLSRSRRDFQLQTFHHEFTHVAAFPLAGPFVPSWIHEGLADWMAGGRLAPTAVDGSDGLLPHDWEFTTGGGDSIVRAYDESTSAMAFLAAKKGKGAPLDLLVRVGEARVAPGTSDYRVDQALRAVYGAGLDQFQKDWNGGR